MIARVKKQYTFPCLVRRRHYLQILVLLMVLFPISIEWVFGQRVRLILVRRFSKIE